jgi:hypothetical protein
MNVYRISIGCFLLDHMYKKRKKKKDMGCLLGRVFGSW